MANVIGRHGARVSPSNPRNEDTHTNPNDDFGRVRRLFLQAGDLAFLVCVGIAAPIAACAVHELGWPFVPTCLLGMIAAMALQTLLAVIASPILGSIESMVPSMIVAMASPMAVCVLHLARQKPTRLMAMMIGSVVAMAMFVFVQL